MFAYAELADSNCKKVGVFPERTCISRPKSASMFQQTVPTSVFDVAKKVEDAESYSPAVVAPVALPKNRLTVNSRIDRPLPKRPFPRKSRNALPSAPKQPAASEPMMVTSFLKDISFGSNFMNSSSYANDAEFSVEEPV